MTPGRRVVIGVGNPDCGDDGVGPLVAQRLRAAGLPDLLVREQSGEATALLDCLRDVDSVWMIDAATSGAPVGFVHRVDCTLESALPAQASTSSHGLGVAEAMALGRVLGVLPRVCILYAVEGAAFAPGASMAAAVLAAVDTVVARVTAELRSA